MSTAKTSAKSTNGEALPKNEAKTTKNTSKTAQQETPEDANLEIQAAMAEADEWKTKAEKLLKEKEAITADKDKAEKTALELSKAKAAAEKNAKKPLSVQEAIEKGKSLAALTNKLDLLIGKKHEITAFKFGGGEHSNEALKLTNANGGSFSTTNSGVLDEVKQMVLSRIDKAIAETEKQIIEIG